MFFNTIAGEEVFIDIAVEIAATGYIQRFLIKAIEDVKLVPGYLSSHPLFDHAHFKTDID